MIHKLEKRYIEYFGQERVIFFYMISEKIRYYKGKRLANKGISHILPTLTVYIVKKPCKSLKSSGLQSFFLCYQMCVQIFIF